MSSKSDRGTKRPRVQKPDPSGVVREPAGPIVQEDCGCREQRYNDETVDSYPCVPHAFQKAAAAIVEAGNAIGYIGHTLQQAEAAQRAMAEMNDEVDEGIEDGTIK